MQMTYSFQFIIYWCKWCSQPLNKFQCSIRKLIQLLGKHGSVGGW